MLELSDQQKTIIRTLIDKHGLSEEDAVQAVIVDDPVLWAETNLCNPKDPTKPIYLRELQKKLIRTQVKKKVSRIGRRGGKTCAMCIEILWYANTHDNKRVLVVAPFESQIEEIFDTIHRLIQYSPDIRNTIVQDTKKPYLLRLANDTIIRGMTLSAKSGEGAGAAARGKSPDKIYVDEMDYLPRKAMVALKPMLIMEDTTIWCSSTPSGKREDFYQICTDKTLGYTEIYASTQEALGDEYTDDMELEFRATFTDIEYEHEIIGAFSEEMAGVFRHDDIERCMELLPRSGMEPPARHIHDIKVNNQNRYVLGVDWNKIDMVGTRMVLMEQILEKDNKNNGKFRLAYIGSVEAKEYTQIKGAQFICELFLQVAPKVPEPNFQIYVDEGYGHTNVEIIRKWGDENQIARIMRCLHTVDFGGKIKIKDPITKRDVDKPAKPLIVNSSVKFIEDWLVFLPESEDVRNGLVGQMRQYRVTNRGLGGNPTYTKDNDHDLTAFMLSCYGFVDKFSDMSNYMAKNTLGKARIEKNPIASSFISVRDTEINKSKTKYNIETPLFQGPKFAEAATNAGFKYNYAGTNKDYENVMAALGERQTPKGVNPNAGIWKDRKSIIPIDSIGPRGTTKRGRIQRGYRSQGF